VVRSKKPYKPIDHPEAEAMPFAHSFGDNSGRQDINEYFASHEESSVKNPWRKEGF